jgi:hypothetical protein
MGVIGRLALPWGDASFAVVAALAWLFASFASCPRTSVKSVSTANVEINPAIPSPGPIMISIEDDDLESEEDHFDLCCLPDVRFVSFPPLTPSQITPPRSSSLSLLTSARYPLRC